MARISKRPILYGTWNNMIGRCQNPNNKDYPRYGGRGIFVCDKWKSHVGFNEDMLPTYEKGLELDRIDNNGPYSKENCRWTTRNKNNANRNGYRELPTGVYKKKDRFQSTITIEKTSYTIGTFDTAEEAHEEFLRVKREWYGK